MGLFSDVDFDCGDGSSSVVSSTLSLFRKVRKFDVGFDRAASFLTTSRVELIGKRSIFGLETTTNR